MDFDQFLHAHGLVPPAHIVSGKWTRCPTVTHPKKKNGSFKLANDGLIGWCQNFETGEEVMTWRPEHADAAPKIDHRAIAAKQAEERRQLVKATQAARAYYANCKPLIGGHPYLTAHSLRMDGCHGLRVDADGWMVVPMWRDGNLMSIQRISPDGEKKFWYGASAKGAGYMIDRPTATITVVCEGLATGLAVFSAAPLTRVLVTFNAGNLANVDLRPRGLTVVASDNDHRTVCRRHKEAGLLSPFEPFAERPEWCLCNPGLQAAQKAAKAIGCRVATPAGMTGTDWCDWRNEELARRLSLRDPMSRSPESALARAVDAEIAACIARNSVYIQGVRK